MGNIQSDEHEPVTIKHTERGWSESQGIQYAVSGMQGMRHTMEDKHILCDHIPLKGGEKLTDHAIFAVFDGHGGDFTSRYLEEHFLIVFSRRAELTKYASLPRTGMKSKSDVTGIQLLKQALIRTFIELDQKLVPLQEERNRAIRSGRIAPPPTPDSDADDDELKKKPTMPEERSGSTCCVVVLTPTHCVCANAGDSRAILQRDGNVLPLSFDHKPSDVPERKRIVAAGGVVKGKRVDGDLAVSRAFGDFVFKQDKDLPVGKQRVIVVPDVLVYPREKEKDEFIVVACDGVWDVASNRQCAEFVQTMLSGGEMDLGTICEEALDTCLDRRSRDNMTMMVVGLPGLKAATGPTALVTNALWGPRVARAVGNVRRGSLNITHKACLSVGHQFIAVENVVCSS